ncbi:MAG: outer membrane protein heavy metal efflux system [Pseudomonadota bacterium]|nr:outer membrane protein heavy metal efflux system [Pseudomonadota bacterium]
MKFTSPTKIVLAACMLAWCAGTGAQERTPAITPGNGVESLLDYARQRNPELAAMRHEADAANERVTPAGALPDPKLRTELRDITRFGEQNPTLSPSRVGSTKYLLMQDLPWYGKRELKREIAEADAEGAKGRAQGTWSDVAAKIKTNYVQLWYVRNNETLMLEILDLMRRFEKVAQARYANGLAMQQDVIRAQVEQTALRNDLIMLDSEKHHLQSRINTLLARPPMAPLANPEHLRPLPSPAKLDPASLEDRLRGRNPQLFAEESRIKAAEKNRELTYKNRYPDFTLGVSPIQYQTAVKEWELMVEMNIPLQLSSRRAQERESESMLSAARARKESATYQLIGELSENLASIETARRTETLTTNTLLPQAELTFRSAVAGYENGKVDFATLIDAQRQIRQSKQTRIKAQAEAQIRLAEVERLLGEEL